MELVVDVNSVLLLHLDVDAEGHLDTVVEEHRVEDADEEHLDVLVDSV